MQEQKYDSPNIVLVSKFKNFEQKKLETSPDKRQILVSQIAKANALLLWLQVNTGGQLPDVRYKTEFNDSGFTGRQLYNFVSHITSINYKPEFLDEFATAQERSTLESLIKKLYELKESKQILHFENQIKLFKALIIWLTLPGNEQKPVPNTNKVIDKTDITSSKLYHFIENTLYGNPDLYHDLKEYFDQSESGLFDKTLEKVYRISDLAIQRANTVQQRKMIRENFSTLKKLIIGGVTYPLSDIFEEIEYGYESILQNPEKYPELYQYAVLLATNPLFAKQFQIDDKNQNQIISQERIQKLVRQSQQYLNQKAN